MSTNSKNNRNNKIKTLYSSNENVDISSLITQGKEV
jgi:hypothetical protein